MLKNLDLKVSNSESYRAVQFYWNCTLCVLCFINGMKNTVCVILKYWFLGPRARDFFMKSTLPVEVLSKIW